jgi:undecaprenyl-diphosphatase
MGRAATAIVRSSAHAPRTLLNFVTARDHRVMTRVNGWRPPRWFRVWMLCATRGGDGWLWCPMALVLIVFGGIHGVHATVAGAIAAGAGVACFIALKRAIRRPRPCAIASHCWAELLPPDQFSFPSGHSITAFAMAICLGLFYPSLLAGLLFCAVSIALSRVVLGMHYLSDVIVGSTIGAILGYAAFLAV